MFVKKCTWKNAGALLKSESKIILLSIVTIIKVSPKGQITIPKSAREEIQTNKFLFEMKGKTILLHPVVLKPLDDIESFSSLSEKSFSFWNNDKDDIYEDFYSDQK